MSDTTIVAVVILGGVFLVMSIAIVKAGVDGAVRIWSVMGALTGVAFGSITSYYFTNEFNQQEIRQAKLETKTAELALADFAVKAAEANRSVTAFAAELKGEPISKSSTEISKIMAAIPEDEREKIVARAEHALIQLKDIENLKAETDEVVVKDTKKK